MIQTDTTPFVVRGESSRARPRISRETRRLLMTAFLAVLALWLLARLRFPDRPVNPNPVPPLLTQLAVLPRFSDLASTVQDVRARLSPLLTSVAPVAEGDAEAGGRPLRIPALRIDEDLAVVIVEPAGAAGREPQGLIARDPASNLALVRVERSKPTAIPILWQAQRLDEPRFLIAASPSLNEVSMRPVFVGGMTALRTPRWSNAVWAVPDGAALPPGSIVFTEDAELVGVAASYDGGVAIVPAREVLSEAEAMRTGPPPQSFDVGIEVQTLSPSLAIASGSESGVVVTWIDRAAPAARDLRPGDVIAALDGEPVRSVDEWRVRMARGRAGAPPVARVIRGGAGRDVPLATDAPAPSGASPGMTLRAIAGTGAEIAHVDRGSAADAAGLESGDVVTAVGSIDAPTPGQVRAAFRAAQRGEILIVAITRGKSHRVVGLQK